MTATIHPTAIVEDGAQLGDGVVIGPYATIGAEVVLGDRVEVKSHGVVTGKTTVGEETVIFSFAVVGEIPQDLKFDGEETTLVIGKRNRIREHATLHTGTAGGGGVTRVGDDCLLMGGCHIAHDVQLGNRIVVANHTGVAGHAIIEDDVIIGGLSGIHQFVRVGRGAIIGGMTRVTRDIIPFGLVQNASGELEGLNLIGLKRRGFSREDISEIRAAFAALGKGEGTFMERANRLDAESENALVKEITAFVLADTDRSYLVPRV
ncbi:MAG: acyl-ACP--UDP-N-acetylglucosamine O-acyltransferase [Paracoccaceae bacterium]